MGDWQDWDHDGLTFGSRSFEHYATWKNVGTPLSEFRTWDFSKLRRLMEQLHMFRPDSVEAFFIRWQSVYDALMRIDSLQCFRRNSARPAFIRASLELKHPLANRHKDLATECKTVYTKLAQAYSWDLCDHYDERPWNVCPRSVCRNQRKPGGGTTTRRKFCGRHQHYRDQIRVLVLAPIFASRGVTGLIIGYI
jgi:hypothetical protein